MEQTTIDNDIDIDDEHNFKATITETLNLYIKDGPRSNSNVNHLHNYFKKILFKSLQNNQAYSVELECKVESKNSSKFKRCDIVILKNNDPYIVFPVKFIKSNYKQNKNNLWENLTGELQHLMWANEKLKIIPINIFMNKTPYLKSNKQISKFENITFDDINIYNLLISKNIAYDVINYIILVNHEVNENDYFNKIPTILGFDNNTPHRKITDILEHLL